MIMLGIQWRFWEEVKRLVLIGYSNSSIFLMPSQFSLIYLFFYFNLQFEILWSIFKKTKCLSPKTLNTLTHYIMADLTRFFGQFCTIYFYITFSKKGTQAFISYCMGCFSTRNLQQDIFPYRMSQKYIYILYRVY